MTETRSSTTNEGSLINDIIIKLTPVIQRTVSTAVVQEPAIQRTVSVVQQRPVSSQSTVTVQTGGEDQQGNVVNQNIVARSFCSNCLDPISRKLDNS